MSLHSAPRSELGYLELQLFNRDTARRLALVAELLCRQRACASTHVHELAGVSALESARLYSPTGRVEARCGTRLSNEFERMLGPNFSRLRVHDLTVTRYSTGQQIVSHFDGRDVRPCGCRKVGTISALLEPASTGGAFFVEHFEHPISADWLADNLSSSPGEFSADYSALRRCRKMFDHQPGMAVMFGPLCPHGVTPVAQGTCTRIVGFLFSPCKRHAR